MLQTFIHSFIHFSVWLINRAPSPYGLGSKNNYGSCHYEMYNLVGNQLLII